MSLSPESCDNLLRYSQQLIAQGNVDGARQLLRSLAKHEPSQQQVWYLLAQLAETPAETLAAEAHCHAHIPPSHTLNSTTLTPLTPPSTISRRIQRTFVLALLPVGAAVLFLIMAASWGLLQTRNGLLSDFWAQTPQISPIPTPQPYITPTVVLPGYLFQVDDWYITFSHETHAQFIPHNLGHITPSGRFLLVLLGVHNDSPSARTIPPDVVLLSDMHGTLFRPIPGSSRAYLERYGGTYGDMSADAMMPAHSGMRSVPFIFDVPNDMDMVLLTVKDHPHNGWLLPVDNTRKK